MNLYSFVGTLVWTSMNLYRLDHISSSEIGMSSNPGVNQLSVVRWLGTSNWLSINLTYLLHCFPQLECEMNSSFRCGNGECVSIGSKCNQLVDCADGSDEKNCSCADFLKSQFLTRKICDGIIDCWDFSDEYECGKYCVGFWWLAGTICWNHPVK